MIVFVLFENKYLCMQTMQMQNMNVVSFMVVSVTEQQMQKPIKKDYIIRQSFTNI